MSPEVILDARNRMKPTTSERVLPVIRPLCPFLGPFRIDQQRQEVTRNGAPAKAFRERFYQVSF